MAWQLHYTSARAGRTGQAGFRFVAETPGVPPWVPFAVTPFMSYRPPPEAPISPGDDELAGFPVALAYDRIIDRPALVRCRYLGRDYSGRYGNFLAHAVVAEPDELEGLRPVELWHADLWDDVPREGDLPALDDLPPGAAIDPELLGRWLADTSSYDLLATLVDAVVDVLDRGHGRVVLVAADVDLIVRWIAALSYSLPLRAAALMSFITYSGDPDGAPHRVVGTTPDAWALARQDDDAYFVDEPTAPASVPSSVPSAVPSSARSADESSFARAVASCWRDLDLAGLDTLGELTAVQLPGARLRPALDRAAALLDLCRTAGHAPEAVELLERHATDLPDWVWDELRPAIPDLDFDAALAVHACALRVGAAEVADRSAARCVALALERPGLRAALPDVTMSPDAVRELAPALAAALRTAPDLTAVAGIATLAGRAGAPLPEADVATAAARCTRAGAIGPPLDPPADLPSATPAGMPSAAPAGPPADPPADPPGNPPGGPPADPPSATPVDPRADPPAGMPSAAPAGPPGSLPAGLFAAVLVGGHEALTAGALRGLEEATDEVRAAVLTDAACDALADRDLSSTPSVALRVLISAGRRRDRRVPVTAALVELDVPAEDLDRALLTVWAGPPTPEECLDLLDALADLPPALRTLPSRAFARLAADGCAELAVVPAQFLARRVLGERPGRPEPREPGTAAARRRAAPGPEAAARRAGGVERQAAADAGVVLAYAGFLTDMAARDARETARRLAEIHGASGVSFGGEVFAAAAGRLAGRSAGFRAEVLAAASKPVRGRLAGVWTGGRPGGAARNELVEVTLRLRALGAGEPGLEEWARGVAGRRLGLLKLEVHLRDDRELRAALRELAAEGRRARGSAPRAGRRAGRREG